MELSSYVSAQGEGVLKCVTRIYRHPALSNAIKWLHPPVDSLVQYSKQLVKGALHFKPR